ncbi:hypothetical protein Tco_0134652 [Tanacetum coccineum]
MHNNIMAAGSKDRPPMLGPGRYSQWHSRFLRYLDTKSNGEYLRKCIFEGPYMPTNVLIAAVEAAENILPVAAHEEAETIHNMTAENKLYFQAEKEASLNYAFLTVVEPKTYKDALPQACWIEAIQEELNEFKQLEVWELIPRPHKPVVYRQEEGYRFDESFALGVSVYEAYKDFLRIAAHMNMVLYLKWMISQSLEGIFITVKYALESLMNTVLTSCDLVDTPNGWKKIQLDEDKKGKSRRSVNTINAFADADHAGCQDTRVAF